MIFPLKSLIDPSLYISGFMDVSELLWLAEAAKTRSTIVELGSFQGRSTMTLANATPGVVYALDNWSRVECLDGSVKDLDMSRVRVKFFQNLQAHIESGKVIPIDVDHRSSYQLSIKPDMVFIDGGHRYEEAADDIQKWIAKVQPGGLLSGHDITWPGVKRAVEELCPGYEVAPGTSIWFTATPSISES